MGLVFANLPTNLGLFFIVVCIGLMRLAELIYGEMNARTLLANGGREFEPWQRPAIVMIYALWLAVLALMVPSAEVPQPPFLALFVLCEVLRWWAMLHLKNFWTTRIIIMPLAWKITTGPYRLLKHPIYIALIGEVVALSAAYNQWSPACFFGGLVGLWLYYRIKAETRALQMML